MLDSSEKPPVIFHFEQTSFRLSERTRLKHFLRDLFKDEGRQLTSLSYIFCSDTYLLNINKQFLQHDFYTDIITFNLAANRKPVEGEIYISLDRVKENAWVFGQSAARELHRVIFHGALHLCGYKDKNKKQRGQMRQKEEYYLQTYFR